MSVKYKSIPHLIYSRYHYPLTRMSVWRWRRRWPLPNDPSETDVCVWFERIAIARNLDVELARMKKAEWN